MIGLGMAQEGLQCKDCGVCPEVTYGLYGTYDLNPADNPWFASDEPDSADFAGLLVTSITGLEPGKITRTVTEKIGIGAIIGTEKQLAPQIVVTGLLMARTCAGMEYGYRWLRKALRGSCSVAGVCAGDTLTFLSAEPTFPDEDCGPVDFEAALQPYLRTMQSVSRIDGPTITSIIPRGCPSCYECGIFEIQWTMSAADPCVYRIPTTIVNAETFHCVPGAGDCIEWVTDGTDCDDDCPADAPCATDPNCVDISPPAMPTIINTCVNDCISATNCELSFDIPDGTFPSSASGTLILSIYAGDEPLSQIEVKVWENPLELAPSELEDCAICSSLAISYVAAGATLTIDGAARSSTISCVGGSTVRANPFIGNTNNTPNFSYPSFDCDSYYTVTVSANGPISSLASITAQAVAREC